MNRAKRGFEVVGDGICKFTRLAVCIREFARTRGDTAFELIDWNFPTSLNQPPVEAPRRIRPERTAIGVTWATRNPLPLSDNLAPADAPQTPAPRSDESQGTSTAMASAGAAGTAAADRERSGVR